MRTTGVMGWLCAHVLRVVPGAEEDMEDELPPNEYYEYFGPDYRLHIPPEKDLVNKNKREALEKVGTLNPGGEAMGFRANVAVQCAMCSVQCALQCFRRATASLRPGCV